jgi:methionyl-tRNA synthetase
MPKPVYITTAIDYTNGAPHIGHAYEKVLADTLARYHRFAGREVYFLTGVDQHGQKVQQSAEKEGIAPKEFSDRTAGLFIALWEKLSVHYDGWAATTDPRHKKCVQRALQQLNDAGQLYKKGYKGFYSVRQEQFLTDKERGPDGQFGPEWGEVVELEEENWYFRLSEHVEWLKAYLHGREDCVIPSFRRQELLNAMERAEAGDLCISRPKARLQWGIEIPFDTDFVNYVWFDALMNYASFAGFLADPEDGLPDFDKLWPADIQIIGKDILVPPHGVYWLIMLHALGIPDDKMPRILVHGWWNLRGRDGQSEKMSKSLGNVVDPNVLADTIGADGLRYYLMRDIATGHDADFSQERLLTRYNADLANDIGNLANRSLNMIQRYREGRVACGTHDDEFCQELRAIAAEVGPAYTNAMENHLPHAALEAVWKWIVACNQFIDKTAPFKLAKDPEAAARLDAVLFHLADSLARISLYLAPVMPVAAGKLMDQLQLTPEQRATLVSQLDRPLLPEGHVVGKPTPIFPRHEEAQAT